WRDGYWSQHVNHWIWQPARVVFVGDGYRTISGYWDYEPQNRGQGYAAVVFHPQTLDNSNYTFEPYYPLSRAAALLLHLFVRAEPTHLYYGDLYSDSQVASGYRPWYLPIEQPSSATPMLDGSNDLTLPPLLDYYQWQYHSAGVDFIASMARYAQHFRSAPGIRPAAQTDKQPELAIREGLAGRVNASSFEQVVLGNVGGRRPLLLDGSPAPADIASHLPSAGNEAAVTQASATQASAASQAPAMSRAKVPVGDSRLERSLSSNYDSAGTSGSEARAGSARQLPRGAIPFGQRGNAAMLVLPGGRVVLAPPGMVPPSLPIGPGGAFLPPPGFPLPPGPLSLLRDRFGHR
ncbi:MAG: hypothetical protein KDA72_07315, partial [Planctomycetales bacterium]|nr:hypothetical protein [Planctomycetales bacterium]